MSETRKRHHRRGDKRRRAIIRDYALRWLGVERLPAGVPALLAELPLDTHPYAIQAVLRPYRKVPWVL